MFPIVSLPYNIIRLTFISQFPLCYAFLNSLCFYIMPHRSDTAVEMAEIHGADFSLFHGLTNLF